MLALAAALLGIDYASPDERETNKKRLGGKERTEPTEAIALLRVALVRNPWGFSLCSCCGARALYYKTVFGSVARGLYP